MVFFVVLAGGRGERLRPLTDTRPKPSLPILGEPLVCRHLRLGLQALGVRVEGIGIVASYKAGELAGVVENCIKEVDVEFVQQGGELGTGHAVLRAMEAMGPGEYVIVYGDVYLEPRFYRLLAEASSPALLAGYAEDASRYGLLSVSHGVLENVVEKPGNNVGGGLVFIGGLRLDHDTAVKYLRSLEPSPRGELEVTDALNAMARDFEVEVLAGGEGWRWLDVGRPWDFLLANRMALEAELEPKVEGEVHSTAVLEGPVYVAPGAEIGPHSVVEGPAWIGPGVKVGPGAHVRPYTVLSQGSKVGFASEVKSSVLLEGARAPHLNYVGDSVVGEEVNLGAGTITANLRFDGRSVKMSVKGVRVDTGLKKLGAIIGGNAQTGINVSIMPGVKIGAYSRVWPGCVVSRDVPTGGEFKC